MIRHGNYFDIKISFRKKKSTERFQLKQEIFEKNQNFRATLDEVVYCVFHLAKYIFSFFVSWILFFLLKKEVHEKLQSFRL